MTARHPETAPAPAGRFAPSPSGDLHLGNLRTALAAWGFARATGRRFLLRVEDLDRVKRGAAERNVEDLRSIGLDWDGPVDVQSERIPVFLDRVRALTEAGLTYECFCTRKEIHAAASAPHGIPGAYPGTCRELTDTQRERRRTERPPAVRLRAGVREFTVHDSFAGEFTGAVDDMVLVRNDGTPAYNLAVVVDDAEQGVDQVVRGDDLLPSAPRQAYLAELMGYEVPEYAHVPLVLGPSGDRLAKRDGAVTLRELQELGYTAQDVVGWLARSLGITHPVRTAADVLEHWDPPSWNREPTTFKPWPDVRGT
ncbi:tRNA glutamyl-Q(34) synthetase GluQRS [Kocuria rhizophila]|uniref:Glutamyl-Q tRNA(Asp) synthetase n=1 Tax=Kocuria rhizophila (strain ATCC 9341 / DSM 348 / NBRC 103217 / DC2201) TaxID=378753 RepID=B2GHL1_KOCRD|nr:tRNA glutamyl-Q(34) synthetase GluQRS [Kocuria rhizophila]ASE11170.1 tRNA glutamyl-Q(34) synthetase GluQRS [Kocuria rhizophila]MDV5998457.1 tRNA glutamyl-Q(34) synthetase GluQRS [Kocuria rhizophila]BAG28850.1 glutamyl-Q-tRNA(Asp) synthetase [Kocuria rhizophila DC2201]VEH75857.1 Glutamate--tRNA ligase 1 [Kocuria rhizophila]